MNLFQSKPFN